MIIRQPTFLAVHWLTMTSLPNCDLVNRSLIGLICSFPHMEGFESIVKCNKKLVRKYFNKKEKYCLSVSDVLVELGRVYSFDPVLKDHILAENIYEYYRSKLIDTCRPSNGFTFYIDEVSSPDKCHQLILSIIRIKRFRFQRHRMVLRATIKIIVPRPPKVGLVRIYDLPCKEIVGLH